MEFGIREIVALMVLLVLAGIAVGLLLQYQRNRHGRIKSRVKYRYDEADSPEDNKPQYGSELPRGGARVVGYRDPDDIKTVHQRIRQQAEASRPKLSMFREKPEQVSLGLDADAGIPMLLDPAEMEPELPPLRAVDDEPEIDPLFMDKIRAEDHPEAVAALQRSAPAARGAPPVDSAEQVPQAPTRPDRNQAEAPRQAEADEQDDEEIDDGEIDEVAEDDGEIEVLVLNLIAPEGTMLAGEVVDRALRDQGLRFGEMDIYHYVSEGRGAKSRFSVANILNPGTFSQVAMTEFATPGLCFFMTLSSTGSNQNRFNTMLEISDRVAKALGARLHDEQRSVLTRQTIEHYRNRIRDFERRRMLR